MKKTIQQFELVDNGIQGWKNNNFKCLVNYDNTTNYVDVFTGIGGTRREALYNSIKSLKEKGWGFRGKQKKEFDTQISLFMICSVSSDVQNNLCYGASCKYYDSNKNLSINPKECDNCKLKYWMSIRVR